MGYKDRDIIKLKKYANSFGLKVYTRQYTRYTGSAEYVSGEYITIFIESCTTKDDIILSLLHELGHHLDWLSNKKTDMTSVLALNLLVNGPMIGKRNDIPKKYRKKILQIEKAGVKYMSKIHKLLNLEIPIERVKKQEKIDIFDYQFLYDNARFATCDEMYIYRKGCLDGK